MQFHIQTHQVISNAGKLDAQKRRKLQNLYIKTETFLGQLDTELIKTLEKSWGDLKTTLAESIKQVAPTDQYVVLVAGEIFTQNTKERVRSSNSLEIMLQQCCVISSGNSSG